MEKKILLSALAAMMALACAKEPAEIVAEGSVSGEEAVAESQAGTSLIGATLGEVSTRTSLALEGKSRPVLWTAEDAIGIIAADGSSAKGTIASGEGKSDAFFSYDETALGGEVAYGYYPYSGDATVSGTVLSTELPAVQKYEQGSAFAPGVAVMAAKKSGDILQFSNTCPVVQFKLKGTGLLTKVFLRSLSTPLAGKGTVDLSADAPAFSLTGGSEGLSYQIELDLGAGVELSESEATSFCFVIPAGSYDDLSLMTVGGNGSFQVLSTSAHTFAASHVKPMGELSVAHPSQATDLSAGEKYANCYMVSPSATGTYSFDLKLVDGTSVAGAASVDCLWETSANLVSDIAFDQASGKAYFTKSAEGAGNALLAAFDASGKVLQTWHIWITDYKDQSWGRPDSNNYNGKDAVYYPRMRTFMDRNLGATYAPIPEDALNLYTANSDANVWDYFQKAKALADAMTPEQAIESCGFLYQFGREVPFPSLNATGLSQSSATWEGSGQEPFGPFTRELVIHPFHEGATKFEVANKYETRAELKASPLTFNKILKSQDETMFTSWAKDAVYTGAWAVEKTNSDPCPYGYRVPEKDELMAFRRDGANYRSSYDPSKTLGGWGTTWFIYGHGPYGEYAVTYAAQTAKGKFATQAWDYKILYVPRAGFRSAGGSANNANGYTGTIKTREAALWCFGASDNGAEHSYIGYENTGVGGKYYPNEKVFDGGDVYAQYIFSRNGSNVYEPNTTSVLLLGQVGSAMSVRCVKQ